MTKKLIEGEVFDNYLSDCITTEEFKKLLNLLKKKLPGDPFLIFNVNDSGDGMVSGDATTWMQVSSSKSNMFCHMLQDDDGKTELKKFDMTLSGLADCLDALDGLQDEVNYEVFYLTVKKLLNAKVEPATKLQDKKTSLSRYFEFKDKESSKFWEITVTGKKVSIHYGKIGTAGQNTVKELATPTEASAHADKVIGEKTKKGYKEVK